MEDWIAEVVGVMHIHKITNILLAKHLGVTPEYVSTILNKKRCPLNAESKFRQAISEMTDTQTEA